MVVPPAPKGGISAPDYGLSYRQEQNREFRKWYRAHHHPFGIYTDPSSKFYNPGLPYTYWRKKFPREEREYKMDEDRAFRRFVDTGEYPGYPKRFIYT